MWLEAESRPKAQPETASDDNQPTDTARLTVLTTLRSGGSHASPQVYRDPSTSKTFYYNPVTQVGRMAGCTCIDIRAKHRLSSKALARWFSHLSLNMTVSR